MAIYIENIKYFFSDLKTRILNISRDKAVFSLILPLLLSISFCIFAGTKEGGFDLIMGIILPIAGITGVFLLIVHTYEAPLLPACCFVILIFTGVCLQVQLAVNSESALEITSDLVIFYMLGILMGVGAIAILDTVINTMQVRTVNILLTAVIFGLYIVLGLFGSREHGTKAWLHIGSFSLQVTDLIRLLGTINFALIFTDESLDETVRLIYGISALFIHGMFLFVYNELGTLILLIITFGFLAISYISSWKKLLCLLLAILCLSALAYLFCKRADALVAKGADGRLLSTADAIFDKINMRIGLILNPDSYNPLNEGYQIKRAREGLALAGLWGVKMDVTMPVLESDFIFNYSIQRFGIVFGISLIGMHMLTMMTAVPACLNVESTAEGAIGAALIQSLVVQSLLAAASGIGIIPTVGIPMVFLSRGGTSAITSMTMVLISTWVMRKPLTRPMITAKAKKEAILCR